MPPDGAATRRRLIEATADVVRDVGYAGATTKAIAQAAGVSEGTIYRHFSHKHELFFAAVMRANDSTVSWITQLPALAGTRTVAENLTEAFAHFASLRHDLVPLELALQADPALAREHERLLAGRLEEGRDDDPAAALAKYLRAEQELGRVRRELPADLLALALLSTLAGLSLRRVPDQVLDRTLAVAMRAYLEGLQAAP